MRYLKRLFVLLLLVLVLIFGALLTVANDARAPLDLLLIQLPEQRVVVWLILAFVLGGVVGLLLSSAAIVRLRGRVILLQRSLGRHDKELVKLRSGDYSTPISKSR